MNPRQRYSCWREVAASEFKHAMEHLQWRSVHQAAQELHMDGRLLSKLLKADPSLTLESVMCIWHAMEAFACVLQSPELAREERSYLADALMRVVESFPLNEELRSDVVHQAPRTALHPDTLPPGV